MVVAEYLCVCVCGGVCVCVCVCVCLYDVWFLCGSFCFFVLVPILFEHNLAYMCLNRRYLVTMCASLWYHLHSWQCMTERMQQVSKEYLLAHPARLVFQCHLDITFTVNQAWLIVRTKYARSIYCQLTKQQVVFGSVTLVWPLRLADRVGWMRAPSKQGVYLLAYQAQAVFRGPCTALSGTDCWWAWTCPDPIRLQPVEKSSMLLSTMTTLIAVNRLRT